MSRLAKFLPHIHPKVQAMGIFGLLVALGQQVLLHSQPSVHLTAAEQSYITLGLALVAGFVKTGPFGTVEQEIVKTTVDAVTAMDLIPTVTMSTGTGAAGVPSFTTYTIGNPPPPVSGTVSTAPLLDSPPGTGSAAVLPADTTEVIP